MGGIHGMASVWSSELVHAGDDTQVIRLGNMHICPMSHLTGPELLFNSSLLGTQIWNFRIDRLNGPCQGLMLFVDLCDV